MTFLAVGLVPGCGGERALSGSLTAIATAAPSGQTEASTTTLPPLPPLAGDRLIYRLVDHAGDAQLELGPLSKGKRGTSLSERLSAFDSPYKLISPYSGLRGEAALRVIEVAVADPAVDKYPRGDVQMASLGADGKTATPPATADTPEAAPPRFDPVWNRYRGIYESKVALFAPAPSCYRFRLPDKRGTGRLQLSLYAAAIPPQRAPSAPSSADVEFLVSVDDKLVWRGHASRKNGTLGRWLPAEISLPSAEGGQAGQAGQTLSLCTATVGEGAAAGTAVWGNPELWAEGEGAVAPNLLLILIDTLRADAVPAMPRLQSYARDAVSFSQAISPATWTRPALLGLLGGDLPTSVGQSAEEMIPSERERKRFYALDRRLLPRLLRAAGYQVASIGNNFFLLGYPQIGLSLGFDEVADVRHPVEDTPAISRAALAFLKKNQRRSFFLQLHYDAPHWPYTPPPEFLRSIPDALAAELSRATNKAGTSLSIDPQARAYLGEAAYADAQIAKVLEELARLGLSERTLVVIVGDHGEIFDPQHNHYVPALRQPTMYHHGWSAYDEILRVPLLLAMPGRLPSGVEVKSQVRLIDVAPTVLELLGLGAWRSLLPSGARGTGQSLLPLLPNGTGSRPDGNQPPEGRPAFVEGQNIRALRSGGYLYLRRGDPRLQRAQGDSGVGPVYKVSEELYDLRSDPTQHRDLLAAARDAKSQLSSELTQTLTRLRDEFARHAPLPPEQGLPITHLLLAKDARAPHLLKGTLISTDLSLSVQGVKSGEVVPSAPGRIDISLRPGGSLDVLVDPNARLELLLYRDGLMLGPRELLLGPFSLPLLPETAASATAGPIAIEGGVLDRLSAAYPPVPGERGEVLLWRDQAAPGIAATAATQTASSAGEVATLMRDWGYARPDAPTPSKSNAADGGAATAPPNPPIKTP